ncbi:phosphohydrolase [Pseudomonas kuykendallii]|uniref:phosphohydrolase n=1 Tax=Pseudomonas kuykendallii TaxID=1007099 RepID=UPI0028D49CB4|nr:phosphohydrolase [Pseudomonas kuykendallii]
MIKPICIYHGHCADGFGAAWVVHHTFDLNESDFHAGRYGEAPPDVTDRTVIIVDFSYPRDVLEQMAAQARSIMVIDHHKTAAEALADLHRVSALDEWDDVEYPLACCFDMARSGAGLTWDFFHPGEPRPPLINHIEDRDLWRFALDGTREVQANLFSHPYDFAVWDALMQADVAQLRADGLAIERKHHKDVAELVAGTRRRMTIGGVDVPAANLPYIYSSDAGHLMAKGEPFAACYWDTESGRTFSLRSTDEGQDVSEIAKLYGGGGHRNAAGFRVDPTHPLASHSQARDGAA